MATCFVGNLTWETTADDLNQLFLESNCQPAQCEVVFGSNGRSRGYGLVQFNSVDAANAAIAACNEMDFQGRTIVVREDRGANPSRSGDGEGKQREPISDTQVFVGNLSWDTTDDILMEEFSSFNPKAGAVAMTSNGRSRGFATIEFFNANDCSSAIQEMDGLELDGRQITVRLDRGENKKKKKKRKPRTNNNNQQQDQQQQNNCSGLSVFVGNLSWDTSTETLQSFFANEGFEFDTAEVAFGRNGRSRGWGTVMFFDQETANNAISQLDGAEVDGRIISCRVDKNA